MSTNNGGEKDGHNPSRIGVYSLAGSPTKQKQSDKIIRGYDQTYEGNRQGAMTMNDRGPTIEQMG